MKRRGFTLIELLVVVAIIAVLISILLPALGAARKSAISVVCQTQIRSIATAYYFYAQENNDTLYHMGQTHIVGPQFGLPASNAYNLDCYLWNAVLLKYLDQNNQQGIFCCPALSKTDPATMSFYGFPKLMHNYVGNGMLHDQQSLDGNTPALSSGVRFGRIVTPSRLFVVADGMGWGDAWDKNRHTNFAYLSLLFGAGSKITINHGRSANAGFVDGHTEVLNDTGPGLSADRVDPRDNM